MEKIYEILEQIITSLSPCAINEILDYIQSDLFHEKGYLIKEDFSESQIRYRVEKLISADKRFFKFYCLNGYEVRYGYTQFHYYLLEEPRYLRPKGYIKRCMYCGMPIFVEDTHIFHFPYHCKQHHPQQKFRLLRMEKSVVIYSDHYIHGIMDGINAGSIRLPANYGSESSSSSSLGILSEWWQINELARDQNKISQTDLLYVKAEEYLAEP